MSITRLQGKKILNIEKTIQKFGYNPLKYKEGSAKLAVFTCQDCNEELIQEIAYGKFSHKCATLKGNLYICSKCNEWKSKDNFFNSKRAKYGISPSCKLCYKNATSIHEQKAKRKKNSFVDDLSLYMRLHYKQIEGRCKKNNIPFNLTPEYLLQIYNLQNGICKYSNLPMQKDNQPKTIGWYHPSVDKIDPFKGYVIGNICWVCFGINACKRQLPIKEFLDIMKNIQWTKEYF